MRRLTRTEKIINQLLRSASNSDQHDEREIAEYLRPLFQRATKEFNPQKQQQVQAP
jgi:hypothetical protein